MKKHEIPQHQWAPFLESFSLEHAGRLISVKSRRPDQGIILEVENRPLEALIQEPELASERIAIVFHLRSKEPGTHFVSAPREIRLRTTDEGTEEGVEIDTGDGTTVIVQFSGITSIGIEAA